ncbi:MAG: hypothetical protein KatS3mg105_5125 [Gemmatales bacterium]|nr:MAG: hypothetical protein KatS3mg105_5125 [Gemmatales bacterium]GIW97863.1 MAG: hypothetical protein KatS3mg111_1196 [Pirellulaceae bacterium]
MKHVVVFDTPSIKQYVFGTDPLREIRGASANLDRLNRTEMHKVLNRALNGQSCTEVVYANGGSAQFIVDQESESDVRAACERVIELFARDTVADVFPVYGVATWNDDSRDGYRNAVEKAHFELRARREFGVPISCRASSPLLTECASSSHLPASRLVTIGGDYARPLSSSSAAKERRGRLARDHGVWAEWMRYLATSGHWPGEDDWDRVRCESIGEIGQSARTLDGYVGLVYADGNAMGQIVQQLDSPTVYKAFSEIVDSSVRDACFRALAETCSREIESIRAEETKKIPADILLLGGDDLLVAVPADRSLEFAKSAAQYFQDLTAERIANADEDVREFFAGRGISRMTISCGVAVARSTYPFFLLLDLVDELLKNAKRGDVLIPANDPAPARIDFHVVAGANSFSLGQTRRDDYAVYDGASRKGREIRRTLRPLTLAQLEKLKTSVRILREVNFPRSKLHALHEAAVGGSDVQARRAIRNIFGRCKASKDRNERLALWKAIESLLPEGASFDFPSFLIGEKQVLAVADIVEAMDIIV